MKQFLILIATIISCYSNAQDGTSIKPRISLSVGFVSPQFFSGEELITAFNIRANRLSYYGDNNNERRTVGNYGPNTGFSLGIGYNLPVKTIRGLSLGLHVNSGQTGSSPSIDGYAEGYFFNFLNFGLGLQYYLLKDSNLYLKGELGMGTVFTKNRFINDDGKQDFLHHFGIGTEGGGGIGYTLRPFKNKMLGVNLEIQYQLYSTRVEVSNIGDDVWQFGALNLCTGIQF